MRISNQTCTRELHREPCGNETVQYLGCSSGYTKPHMIQMHRTILTQIYTHTQTSECM